LNYLLKLSKAHLDEDARDIVDSLFNTVNDIERIGDHAENIAELAQDIIDSDLKLSKQGTEEVRELYNKVIAT
ncbi:sodium-dependent phosphate transporter, partial [Lawsonibacter sp. DFI.6.74]|nr:sodium-dependent phosphate transporter [Lawsonibacter sp. DFI.6.74]